MSPDDHLHDTAPPPPPGAPSLLSFDEARQLVRQGWLPIDLPEDLLQDIQLLTSEASDFFDRDHDDKTASYPPSRGTENGFYHVPNEKEYVTFRHHVHPDTALEQQVGHVWHRVANLLHRVLCDISRCGYYDVQAWDDMVRGALAMPRDGSAIDDTVTLMRLFRYYPTSGFAGEHVDIGLLTLCVGRGRGLQVLDRSRPPQGEWLDVDGPVILVGDTVRGLFDARVRAGLHRVVGNPDGRSSFVFALRPCLTGEIDRAKFGGSGLVSTREFYGRIRDSKYNINATKDIRDEEKRRQDEQRRMAKLRELREDAAPDVIRHEDKTDEIKT